MGRPRPPHAPHRPRRKNHLPPHRRNRCDGIEKSNRRVFGTHLLGRSNAIIVQVSGVFHMPSPFPGMDPYLEGSLWSSVHQQLTAEIARQLAPKILPKYLALTERRFVMSISETDDAVELALAGSVNILPDIAVAHTGAKGTIDSSVAIAPAPLQMATVMPESVPVTSVEIRDTAGRTLIALIEVLSPANK